MSQSINKTPDEEQKCMIVKAPTIYLPSQHRKTIFLAGSIASAIDWRVALSSYLSHCPITLLDPYRRDWDSTWVEDIECEKFRTQTQWELEMQEKATLVAFWFEPGTQAPVSLLELGLVLGKRGANARKEVVVRCPEKYWKRGNVQVVCERYGVQIVNSFEEFCVELKRRLEGSGVEAE
ncbi:hypothetical protein B7463_g9304, partial [Scytalidium lignicola]